MATRVFKTKIHKLTTCFRFITNLSNSCLF